MMTGERLYADRLVEITSDGIRFKAYYFPFGAKWVRFSDMSDITAEAAGLWNGQWHLHGSGDLRSWFPRDWRRPSRHTIFFVHFPRSPFRIGFTVEDEPHVERLLHDRGVLRQDLRAA